MAASSPPPPPPRVRVLFVCLGNICRSPMAEAVFKAAVQRRGLAARFDVDSCGTAGYHVGDAPDERTVAVCRRHNVPIDHVGRQLHETDFSRYDYLLGMDTANIADIERRRPRGNATQVSLFGSFDPEGHRIIEDPYYGNLSDFEQVYQQCVRSSEGFLRVVGL